MTTELSAVSQRTRPRSLSVGAILVVGVVVIPLTLVAVNTGYSTPDPTDLVGMAFATVAGSTIAIATAVVMWLTAVIWRAPARVVVLLALVALVVAVVYTQSISSAAEQLVVNLERL